MLISIVTPKRVVVPLVDTVRSSGCCAGRTRDWRIPKLQLGSPWLAFGIISTASLDYDVGLTEKSRVLGYIGPKAIGSPRKLLNLCHYTAPQVGDPRGILPGKFLAHASMGTMPAYSTRQP